jgi:hypothetical protein
LNKIILAKRNSVIFLASLLVLGTIVTILPSAQAQPYYEDTYKQDYPSSYSQDYEQPEYPSYQPDYKPEYPSDNNYKSEKDSSNSVSLNKLKCINNNVNINGNNTGDINVGNSGKSATGSGTDDEGYIGAYSSGGNGEGYDNGYKKQKDQGFTCIINNNNNNTNVVSGGGNVTDDNGNVKTCDENVRACFDALLNDEELQDLEDAFPFQTTIIQPDPQPPITITIQSLDDFCEAIQETFGAQNPAILSTIIERILEDAGLEIGTEITQTEFQILFRCISEALGIETSIRLVENADSDGSTIALNNNIDNTDFNTNTATTSSFDINTAEGLATSDINTGDIAPSFSSPPTIAQGVENSAGLTSLEKVEKLKQQWLELLPYSQN